MPPWYVAVHDPNRLINGESNTAYDPTNEVKILSVGNPPQLGGWVLGGVYRYLTGGAWGRTFFASGLAHGGESILAEPRDTNRLPASISWICTSRRVSALATGPSARLPMSSTCGTGAYRTPSGEETG